MSNNKGNSLGKLLLNTQSFEKLFKENYNGLFYHAISFLNDDELSRDIVNDVFEEIWHKRKSLDFSVSPTAMLYRMVKFKCINYLNHLKVKQKYIDRNPSKEMEDEEEYKDYDTILKKIKKEIEKLPEQGKAVFMKCFIENLSYAETAEELNISVNTVKTHVKNSLKKLRESINIDILLFFLQRILKKQ